MAKKYEPKKEKTNTVRFRIGGAWKNKDGQGNIYLASPLTPEVIEELIEELEKYKETGCKLLSYCNGYKEEDKHPDYINYIYPFGKKSDKDED